MDENVASWAFTTMPNIVKRSNRKSVSMKKKLDLILETEHPGMEQMKFLTLWLCSEHTCYDYDVYFYMANVKQANQC